MHVPPRSLFSFCRPALALLVTLTAFWLAAPGPAPIARAQGAPCAVPDRVSDSEDIRQVRAGLTELVKAVAACLTAGDYETMARMVSQRYLGQVYGGGPSLSREAFLELAKSFPPRLVRFRDIEHVRLTGGGKATADVKLIIGSQLTIDRMTFIESERSGAWLIDAAEARRVNPPREHDQLRVTIQDNRYDPARLTAESANIEIVVTNEDETDHELLILRFDPGVTSSALLTSNGPGLPPGVHYVGQVTVAADGRASLVLVGMKPGVYAFVDLLPNELGVPHLSFGMEGALTVTD